MTTTQRRENKKCTSIRQVLIFTLLTMTMGAFGQDLSVSDLNPLKSVAEIKSERGRDVANFTPTDDIGFIPMMEEIDVSSIPMLKDDKRGNLAQMKRRLDSWRETEEYAELWDLKSTGLYETPSQDDKKKYVQKRFLKYIDKRIGGEMKHAKKGTALAKARAVEQAVRPDTSVSVAKNVKVRFSGKVLQGYGLLRIVNPYVTFRTKFTLSGQTDVHVSKEFKSVGAKTAFDYDVNAGRYVASLNKSIVAGLSARVSTSQATSEVPLEEETEQKAEIFYGLSF